MAMFGSSTVKVGEMAYDPDEGLSFDMNDVTSFPVLEKLWIGDTNDCLIVYVYGYSRPFRLPLDWIQTSGLASWSFVTDVIQVLVNEPGALFRPATEHGQAVSSEEPLQAGEYVFKPNNGSFTWKKGPIGLEQPPITIDDGEDDFVVRQGPNHDLGEDCARWGLLGRDAVCLLTLKFDGTRVTNLVPFSRKDVYEEVLGEDYDNDPFSETYSVLLASGLQRQYGQGLLAFYVKPDDSSLYAQAFASPGEAAKCHGKVLEKKRFRSLISGTRHPDRRLCRWHWEQCVLQNIRGFSYHPVGESTLGPTYKPPTARKVGSMSWALNGDLEAPRMRYYPTMRRSWNLSVRDCVTIYFYGYNWPFRIPLDWARRAGMDSLPRIHEICQVFVNEPGVLCEPVTEDGLPVDNEAEALTATYVFKPKEGSFTWRNGPFGAKRFGVAPNDIDDDTGLDAAVYDKRGGHRLLWLSFRDELISRDMRCLMSDTAVSSCEPTHLVPPTRPDIFKQVLGKEYDGEPFYLPYGVFLSHGMSYNYQWRDAAFYTRPDDDKYYVQIFTQPGDREVDFHGRVIERKRFSMFAEDEDLPERLLCRWQWEQCILQNFRGFAINPPIAP